MGDIFLPPLSVWTVVFSLYSPGVGPHDSSSASSKHTTHLKIFCDTVLFVFCGWFLWLPNTKTRRLTMSLSRQQRAMLSQQGDKVWALHSPQMKFYRPGMCLSSQAVHHIHMMGTHIRWRLPKSCQRALLLSVYGWIKNTASMIFPFVQWIIRAHDMPRIIFHLGSSEFGGGIMQTVIGKTRCDW